MEEFFHSQRLNLHDVPDIQIVDPLVLIQEAQHAAHVWLLLLVALLIIVLVRGPFNLKRVRLLKVGAVWLFLLLGRDLRVDHSPANFADDRVHFERGALNERNGLLEEVFGDFARWSRLEHHRDELDTLSVLQVALFLRCEQIVPIIYLVDVDLAELFHVFEHLMGKVH